MFDRDLDSMSFQEILDYITEIQLMLPVKDYIKFKPDSKFTYLEKETLRMLNYDKKNAVFAHPYLDEREDEMYQEGLFNDEEPDIFPMRGYFHYLTLESSEKIFGILNHTIFYDHINTKDDPRFYNHKRQWRKEETLLYDFDKEEYIDVPRNPKHENSIKLEERETFRNEILSKLEQQAIKYQKKFKNFYNMNGDGVTYLEIINYLTAYKKFLLQDLNTGLKLHMAYNNIDLSEYIMIMNKSQELVEKIEGCLNKIELSKSQPIYEDKTDFLLNNADTTGIAEAFDFFLDIKKELQYFKSVRPDAAKIRKKVNAWKDGYIGYDLDKMVLYPTVSEIERRRFRTKEPTSKLNETFIQRQYLKFLKANGMPSILPKSNYDSEFNSEAIQQIRSSNKSIWNRNVLRIGLQNNLTIDQILNEIAILD